MKFRLMGLLLVGLTVLAVLPTTAQDQVNPIAALNCLGLSESDCAIVQKSAENTSEIQSFAHNFTFSASVSNASQIVQGLDTAVSAQGSGTFFIDAGQMTEQIPYGGVSLSLDLSGTMTDSNGEQSGEASLVIAGGNVYLKVSDTGAWRGTALADLEQNPGSLSLSVMGMEIPAAQVMQLGAGMSMMGDDQNGALLVNGMDIMALLQLPGFLNQSRLADETVGGQNTAVFAYTADIGALMTNPDVQGAIASMSDSAATGDDPMAQQMALMLPILLQNTSGMVTLTRWIGVNDNLPYRVMLDLNAPVDLGIKSGNGTPIPPIELKLNFMIELSAINTTSAPAAPEDATMVPAQEFLLQPNVQ